MRSSLRMYIALTIAFCGFGMTQPAHAQDLEGCDQIERLVEAGDYPAALVELGWCQRDITELHYQAILEVLEVTVLGYDPGEGKVSAAMGFSPIEITHSDGSNEIKTTIVGGAGGAESAMAGLGALAGLASRFGVRESGVRQVRMGRKTGRLEEKSGGMYSLMVTLDGGQVTTYEGPDGDFLQEFASFMIQVLEEYLGG